MAARPIRLTVILAILACVALVAGGTAAVAESVPAPGDTITGVVTDQQGHPLPGIVIRLRDNGADEGSLVGTTTTDSFGRTLAAK